MSEFPLGKTVRTRWRILSVLVGLLILRVNVGIVLNYRNYLPPDFRSDFLKGREQEFFGSYQWAFWLHLLSGPISLLLGLLLISTSFRMRFPAWHRRLGRVQVINVFCLLAPSGLWMSAYAAAGPIAGVGFATLSLLTGLTIWMGWRTALQRNFVQHRRWMLRNVTLLCSAVVIRLAAGTATIFEYGPDWFDQATAWFSWLVPLAWLEWTLSRKRPVKTLPRDRLQKS